MHTLGVSRNKAYKIIQQLNEELKAQGYVIIAGKCSRKYFNEKFYGYDSHIQKPKGEI
jgi:hypothetical protein